LLKRCLASVFSAQAIGAVHIVPGVIKWGEARLSDYCSAQLHKKKKICVNNKSSQHI